MTSEVKFLHAFIQGNLDSSRDLLPSIDLLKLDNCGFNTALFCLWAAHQENKQNVSHVFSVLYRDQLPSEIASNAELQQIVRDLIVPKIFNELIPFLGTLGKVHVATLTRSNHNSYFVILTHGALTALRNLISLEDANKQTVIRTLQKKLQPFVAEAYEDAGLEQPEDLCSVGDLLPISVDRLMDSLSHASEVESDPLFAPTKSFTPGAALRRQVCGGQLHSQVSQVSWQEGSEDVPRRCKVF